MGGICGIYCNFLSSEIVTTYRMVESMQHRGYDNVGFYTDDYVVLAHNDSKKISKHQAKQPLFSSCKRYVIVYSGEVYNCAELAKRYNLKLTTNNDAEVILELFINNRTDFILELNGAFAFAIYDRKNYELFLYRDRIGIKPLYYIQNFDSFAFGSELKSLITIPKVRENLNISNDSIARYLHLGYIPSPQTIYQNIYKLEQGSMIKFSFSDFEINKWWDINSKQFTDYTTDEEQQAIQELDDLLNDSVKLRMAGHKKIGAMLSGGIDSSLISAISAKHAEEPINTFYVKFDNDKNSESVWAQKISKHIGSIHNELKFSSKEAIEYIPKMIFQYDEPYADSSAIPTMFASKMVSEKFPFVLTGDGGDELFHGYGAHLWAGRLNNRFVKSFKNTIGQLLTLGNSRMQRVSWLFHTNPHIQAHIFSQENYLFSDDELREILITEPLAPWDPQLPDSLREFTPAELQALYDLKHYLSDDLLTKIDRGGMLFGLEARIPLLDHRIVEWSLNLDPNLKIRNKKGKYILRELISKYIPSDMFNRPKRGFAIPLKEWMRGDLKDMFLDYLSPEIINRYDIVNYQSVEQLKKMFYKQNIDYVYNRLWLIIALHMWMEQSAFKMEKIS